MSMLHDLIRDERLRRQSTKPLIMMRVLVEPVLSSDGERGVGRRQLDTGASAVIAGPGDGRIWQRENETIAAFEARIEGAAT